MLVKQFAILIAVLVSTPSPSAAQQASAPQSASSAQAATLLSQAIAALTGRATLSDVTLSGNARRISGSDDESGTVTVKALAGTGTRIDLSFPSGTHSEFRNASSFPPVGSWSGPDGVQHAISIHNLFTDPGWCPAFAISSVLSTPNAVITYVGPETHDGQAVIHITASQQFSKLAGDSASLMEHLTQADIFLDATNNLPVALDFSTHPDSNVRLDIPIEIRFSDYRSVNGIRIPFHVQKYLNNSLLLDFSFQTAALNTGIAAGTFSAQ